MNRQTMKALIPKQWLWVLKNMKNLYAHYRTDCYVISYPKCGRTWLRMMLAKTLALHFKDPQGIVFDPSDVIRKGHYSGPRIRFTHDGAVRPLAIERRQPKKVYLQYRKKKVILLIRDPRDILVSYYFHRSRRMNESHELGSFVRHSWWGADRVTAFMKGWYEHRHVPSGFLLVRYEDLHSDPAAVLREILAFINLCGVSDEVIRSSVAYANFENMHRMSLNELRSNSRLAPSNPVDSESFKMRVGKVGGYVKYLSLSDLEFIGERIRCELPALFGYADSEK